MTFLSGAARMPFKRKTAQPYFKASSVIFKAKDSKDMK
jgi:hypothetical protein